MNLNPFTFSGRHIALSIWLYLSVGGGREGIRPALRLQPDDLINWISVAVLHSRILRRLAASARVPESCGKHNPQFSSERGILHFKKNPQ